MHYQNISYAASLLKIFMTRLRCLHRVGGGMFGDYWHNKQTNSWILNNIGRNSLLGKRKKIAKFLMRTLTYRSTFLYGRKSMYISQWLSREAPARAAIVVDFWKKYFAINSGWPKAELSFFPWLLLFKYWPGGSDLSASICPSQLLRGSFLLTDSSQYSLYWDKQRRMRHNSQ